jgi:hypothetical protein
VDDRDKPGQGDLAPVRKYASVVPVLRRDLPEVDTSLEWGRGFAVLRTRGNDGVDRAAAIADHNGVRDDDPSLDDIDRDKAGAIPIDRISCRSARF